MAFASERVTATEGGAAAIVRVALSADPERTVAVPLTRAPGDGVADGDYAGVPASVTFGAGETAASFTVSATDDAVDEDDERVALGFGTPLPAGVTPGSPSGVTVTLADDDDRGVTVAETALAIDEGAGGSYTVALTSQPTEDVIVTAALSSAAEVSLDRTTLTFTAGDWRTAQTVTVTAAADDDAVVPAAVTITHTVAGGDYDGADAAAVTVRITETDTPALGLVADARAGEAAGSLTFTVRMSVASSDTVTVAWSTAAGTAWAGSDYTQRSGSLTFRPGEPLSRTVSVPIADDRVDEQDETFTVTLSDPEHAELADAVATGTIVDDDTRGVALSTAALAFLEGGDGGSYTVALTSQPTEAVTVAPAAAAGSDADVTFAPASLRFSTVDWATAQTVTVDARQDWDAVNDEATITHGLTGGDYAGLDVASVAVTVLDDETASTAVALAVAPASVAEDVGTAGREVTVTATLNAAPRTESTAVTVAVAPGTALAADFAAVPDVPLTIAAGEPDATATFTLKPVDDEVDEDAETVTVSGTTTSGLTVNPAAGLTLTITDDDQRGVTVSETELEIDEGASGSYTVVLTSQPTADVTVAVTVPPYAGLAAAPLSLTFTADDWDTAQAVTVTAAADDDAIAPAPATLRHAVSGADYGAVRAAPVKVTIVETTVPALAIAGGRAAESAGEVVFTVTLSTADSQAVIVDYASADGTATAGQDYTAVRGSLTFPATDAAPRKIAVPLLDDAADEEEEETFTVTLSAPADADTPLRAALTDATATARGTIADDDDPAVTAAFAAASYAAAEGGAAAAVTVRLSADPERTLVLPLTVAHHGGASADDYAGLPPGRTVRFAAGVQEAAFTITATDDALDDDGESLVLGFGELPDGVTAGAVPAATVTLTDDDATPAVTGATAFAVAEGATAVTELAATDADLGAGDAGLVAGGRRRGQRALHAGRRRRAGVHRRQGLREPGRRRRRPRVRADRAGERRRQRGHRRPDRDPHRRGARGEHRGGGAGGRGGRAGAVHGDPRGRPVRGAGGGAGGDRRRRRAGGHRDGRRAHGGVRRRRGERAARRGHRRRRPGRGGRRGHRDPAGRRRLPARDAGRGHGDRRRRRPAAGAEHRRRRRRRGGCAAGVHGQPHQRGGAGARQRAAGDRGLGHHRRQRRGRRRLHRGGRRHADLRRRADRRHHRGVAAGRRPGRGRRDLHRHPEPAAQAGTLLHAALQDATATGTITDDDTRGVTVSEEALDIDEGASATYTVVLTSQPTDTVTVGVGKSSDSDPDVTASPATLTFTTGTWNTPQTVTVRGGQDADAENDAATIEHTVSGGDYQDNGVTAADVAVTVDDDETAARELTLVLTVAHQDEDGSGDVTLGDVLNYTATATNSGTLTLSAVAVRDLLVSTGGNGCATLAVGAECKLTVSYTVTQVNVDAGQVVNTATATATDVTEVTRSVTTAVAQQRALTLALSADVASFDSVDDTITYAYTVTNSGTVTLSGTVTITDDTVAAAAITCDALPSSGLAPAATASCSGTYATLQPDVDAGGVASSATASLGGTTSAAATLRVPWAAAQGGESPVLTIAGVNGREDAGQFAFAVSLSPASLQTVTVAYATADGTATEGTDYTGARGTLTFAPGATGSTITVTVQDDELDEEDESFTVELSAPSDEATR